MEFVAIAIELAKQILAGFITDAVTGARAARKRELEKRTREAMAKRDFGLSDRDARVLAQRIFAEIRYLANEHPDLEWRSDSVRSVPPVPAMPEPTQAEANALLRQRVERLSRLAQARREQLAVAEQSGPRALGEPIPFEGAAVIGITQQGATTPANYWRTRLEGIQASVRDEQRRNASGGSNELRT